MARGLQTALYVNDQGDSFAVKVKKESVAIASLGWTTGPPSNGALPRKFKMRHVIGVDGDGKTRTMTVATISADAWDGTATTFDARADDGVVKTYTITGRAGERVSLSG